MKKYCRYCGKKLINHNTRFFNEETGKEEVELKCDCQEFKPQKTTITCSHNSFSNDMELLGTGFFGGPLRKVCKKCGHTELIDVGFLY